MHRAASLVYKKRWPVFHKKGGRKGRLSVQKNAGKNLGARSSVEVFTSQKDRKRSRWVHIDGGKITAPVEGHETKKTKFI